MRTSVAMVPLIGLLAFVRGSSAAPIERFAEATLVCESNICFLPGAKMMAHVDVCPSWLTRALAEVSVLHIHTNFAQFGVLEGVDPAIIRLTLSISDRGGNNWQPLTPSSLKEWAWVDDHYFIAWGEGILGPGQFLRISVEIQGRLWEDDIVYLLED